MQKHSNEEFLVQDALSLLEQAGLRFNAHDADRRLVLHTEGLARVEFFPLKQRWCEAGSPKRNHGDVHAFITWYRERAAVRK